MVHLVKGQSYAIDLPEHTLLDGDVVIRRYVSARVVGEYKGRREISSYGNTDEAGPVNIPSHIFADGEKRYEIEETHLELAHIEHRS